MHAVRHTNTHTHTIYLRLTGPAGRTRRLPANSRRIQAGWAGKAVCVQCIKPAVKKNLVERKNAWHGVGNAICSCGDHHYELLTMAALFAPAIVTMPRGVRLAGVVKAACIGSRSEVSHEGKSQVFLMGAEWSLPPGRPPEQLRA